MRGLTKCTILVLLAVLAAFAAAKTLVTQGKVVERTERGFILQVGTEPLATEDAPTLRIWVNCKPAARTDVPLGETVSIRASLDSDPPLLRELADQASASWLENIRRNFVKGTVEAKDAKYLTVKFPDGTVFAYRATEKSKLILAGKSSSIGDLQPGMVLWFKGRLLPNLDTWLAEVRDAQPNTTVATKTKVKTETKAKTPPLPVNGILSGTVKAYVASLRMVDLEANGRLLHFVCGANTVVSLNGQVVALSQIKPGHQARISYKRDPQGRLNAANIELKLP